MDTLAIKLNKGEKVIDQLTKDLALIDTEVSLKERRFLDIREKLTSINKLERKIQNLTAACEYIETEVQVAIKELDRRFPED